MSLLIRGFMDYRRVGRTGLKVSEICLGTMTFGHGADQAETDRIVGTSLDAGVTFFDTADGYNAGQSEIMLGKVLGSRRKQTVIASKVFNPTGPGPNDSGMSRSHILDNIESSLKRLGTDYLDLYYIHHVDIETPLDEMLRAFDDLVRQGKVRYIACSNYEAWRLMEAMWISDSRGLERFACHQPQYSLVVRDIEEEIVPACDLKGLGIVCWSPLAGDISAADTSRVMPRSPAPARPKAGPIRRNISARRRIRCSRRCWMQRRRSAGALPRWRCAGCSTGRS